LSGRARDGDEGARAGGHRQRGALPRQRRGLVDHRHHAASGGRPAGGQRRNLPCARRRM